MILAAAIGGSYVAYKVLLEELTPIETKPSVPAIPSDPPEPPAPTRAIPLSPQPPPPSPPTPTPRDEPQLTWPWPIPTPPDRPRGGKLDDGFLNKWSGLLLCGYHVGETNGRTDALRARFLDCYFRNELPSVVHEFHGDVYGPRGSEKQLQKMANVLSANCCNFKRNDPIKYSVAIRHYETDLDYLKGKYYIAGSFPWPPLDVR